ncbi:hypothetical protein FQZ97_728360 [compost metagenome]
MAFVADTDALVVLDVLVPVALGMQVDLFLALLVLDAQLVVATASGAAVGLQQGAGLVRRQLVGRQVLAVVEAAADQGLIRVAFEEGHQHFHADPRDGDGAVGAAGPARGHPQPAAGVFVGLAVAVPVELHLDAAEAVAVDLLPHRAGDDGGLAAQYAGFGVFERGAVEDIPGDGEEAVAVALLEVVGGLR